MDGIKVTQSHLSEDYLVYSDGRIYSVRNDIFLKPCINNRNYLTVRLYVNKKRVQVSVHRLVGIAFLEPSPNDKPDINHKDGDKRNNDISNLEWTNDSENGKHAYKIGLKDVRKLQGEQSSSAILDNNTVLEIRKLRAAGWKLRELSDRYGIHVGHISKVASGKSWKHLNELGDE